MNQTITDHRVLNQKAVRLLPGYNCGSCGHARCDEFAYVLLKSGKALDKCGEGIDRCRFMSQEQFLGRRSELMTLLAGNGRQEKQECLADRDEYITDPENDSDDDSSIIIGLIDGYRADFILEPLPDENSCREILFPFSRKVFKTGDIIRYRPLGCPVTHFAEILSEDNGLITVHIIGPRHRMDDPGFRYEEAGVCMVGGFEGIIGQTADGRLPFVGKTVRFIPAHCMMQKVHSGVIVQLVGRKAFIEGIDLKVWMPPSISK